MSNASQSSYARLKTSRAKKPDIAPLAALDRQLLVVAFALYVGAIALLCASAVYG